MNLDDKLLGYKKENYCSSSEDEEDTEPVTSASSGAVAADGPKTGPKGVLKDYRRYKEIEREQKKKEEEDKLALFKRLAITCQSANDEEAEKKLEDEEEDKFIEEYHKKRVQQMKEELVQQQEQSRPLFGELYELDRDGFLQEIDKEKSQVSIVIHIYDPNLTSCLKLNRCLADLAKSHRHVKFCKIQAAAAGLSINFQLQALPTLQIYENGILTKNFVRLTDELDHEFYTGDVENFLLDHDVLASSAWQHAGNGINSSSSRKGIFDNDSDDD